MEENNYSSDIPVSSKEEDRFSRWSFSERVAEVISKRSDPGCITIGLYGAWGDGKTSVLNFIEEALSKNNDVIFIKFNPWRFTTEESLLLGFFSRVTESLDAKLINTEDKLKDLIKKVAPGIGAVAGAKGVGDSISSFIAGPDIEELKIRVEAELEKSKKRVLIVIDDVDRLEKSEIQSLFKLIKLTADFRYTAYILAFDKEIVSSSLQDRYSSGSKNSGEAFLEKIIQVPLHLPKVERKVLREFCFQGVDEALSISEIELSEQQVQEFVRDFTYAFDDCLSTPRKAKLYGNTLMFSLPILRGEVNPVDLMLIEGIRVFSPTLYEYIRDNKKQLTGLFRDSNYTNHDNAKESIKKSIDDALDKGGVVEKSGFIQVMKSLFPKLESVYGNMNYGDDFYEIWNNGQRVCSENYFNRYFTYAIPRGDVGDNTILNIIDSIEEAAQRSDESLFSILPSFISKDNSESVIKKFRQKADGLSASKSIPLAICICRECRIYPNPDVLYNWSVPFIQAAMLVNQLIRNLEKSKREGLVITCINTSSCIEFKMEVFKWLRKKDEEKPEKDSFEDDEVERIGAILGDNLKKELENSVDATASYSRSVSIMFYYLNKYVGAEWLEQYVQTYIDSDKSYIVRLLDSYTGKAWGMETGVSHKTDFERRQYDDITSVIGSNIIVDAINEYFGDIPEVANDFPRADDQEDRSILLSQFLWIHRYVENEKKSDESE